MWLAEQNQSKREKMKQIDTKVYQRCRTQELKHNTLVIQEEDNDPKSLQHKSELKLYVSFNFGRKFVREAVA